MATHSCCFSKVFDIFLNVPKGDLQIKYLKTNFKFLTNVINHKCMFIGI